MSAGWTDPIVIPPVPEVPVLPRVPAAQFIEPPVGLEQHTLECDLDEDCSCPAGEG